MKRTVMSLADRTLERSVESEASGADDEVSDECDEEYAVVAILPAVVHAFEG